MARYSEVYISIVVRIYVAELSLSYLNETPA